MPEATAQVKIGPVKREDLNRELLLGILGSNAYLLAVNSYLKTLPAYIDDAERDFGSDIYDRMLRDPALASAMQAIRVMVLADGPRFVPAVKPPNPAKPDPEEESRYQRAVEIRDAIEGMCDNLQAPLEEILGEMLDYLPYGNRVAEKVYAPRNGLLALTTLRPKSKKAYYFIVNDKADLLGLLATTVYGLAGSSGSLAQVDPAAVGHLDGYHVIPREKFWVLSNAGSAGDPRGRSILRPAYNAWFLKQQTWPQYLKFLSMFGTPSLVAILSAEAGDVELIDSTGTPVLDSDGNATTLSAEEAVLQKLIAFENGTAIVLPNGTTLDKIQSTGDGGAYVKAIDLYDRQMIRAVLIGTRATMEAEYGSKADSSTAQDLLSEFAQYIQRQVEMAFYRDVIYPTCVLNWGEAVAREFAPTMSLTSTDRSDVAEMANALANLGRADMIHESQLPGIDAMLNLPERDFQAMMDERQSQREAQADREAMLRGLLPAGGPQDDEEAQ